MSVDGLIAVVAICGTVFLAALVPAPAAETRIAVAANFTEPAREIAREFKKASGHQAILSFGSTGQLLTQIGQGAPFDVFLAGDTERPARAIEKGLAVDGSILTYAVGAIVLYSPDKTLVTGKETLQAGRFEHLAIANPETAPYGAAAVETMKNLDVLERLQPKLVRGNNIAQTFQFVETGNAELGFVAASQLLDRNGSQWIVPYELYEPVRQDAVLLKAGENNEASKAFLDFLKGPDAGAIIKRFGYALGDQSPRSK